jgi:L-asparaginase
VMDRESRPNCPLFGGHKLKLGLFGTNCSYGVEPEPRVYLVRMAAGMDDLFLRVLHRERTRGVVIEGSGAGHMPGQWKNALAQLLESETLVVLTSRCGRGRVVPIYSGDLGGVTLRKMGVITAGDLSGLKARIALMFALGAGWETARIRSYCARRRR